MCNDFVPTELSSMWAIIGNKLENCCYDYCRFLRIKQGKEDKTGYCYKREMVVGCWKLVRKDFSLKTYGPVMKRSRKKFSRLREQPVPADILVEERANVRMEDRKF
jgi:hypothetical protein